jgi:MFS family permease
MADADAGGSSYRWVVLAVAFLVHATTIALVWNSVPPLKKAMAPTLGTGWESVALVYAAFSFGLILTQLPGGALGDRYPVRYVVGLGGLLAGLATALRLAVPTLGGQVAVSVVATVGMGLVNPNLVKVVTEWFPPEQLGLGQGVLLSGNTLGSGVALSVSAGAALELLGTWREVFLVYGALTVGTALLWMATVRSPRGDERPADPETGLPFRTGERVPLRESVSAVFRAPSTKWAVALAGILFWAMFGSLSVLPEFADVQPYAVPESYLGIPLYVAIGGALAIPTLSDRVGRVPVLRTGILVYAASLVVTGFAPSLAVFVLGLLVAGFSSGGLVAMLYVLPGELQDIDGAHVGTMSGVILSLANVGAVAATATSARVLSAFGIELGTLFVAVPCLLGLVPVAKLRLGEGREEPSAVAAELGDGTGR